MQAYVILFMYNKVYILNNTCQHMGRVFCKAKINSMLDRYA